jgi:dolichol-phosphate mannosyltransferase
MLLSVVVPCYNEEPVLSETHRRLRSALEGLKELEFEIIYVDDGSADQTLQILESLQAEDERVRVLRLSRNFGHQIAVTAGLENASGDAVVIIDADLQDPPEVISEMVRRWREGYSVAYGQRIEREGETGFKLWSAKAYYRLINRISETKMPLDTGDFRLMDRKVVDCLLAMPERDRFLRGMVSWVGFKQIAVPYQRARRHAGESKYPLLKMIRFATDGIVSFSIAPLKIAIWTGFLAIWLAIIGIIVAVIVRLMDKNLNRGWASLFVAVLFMGGIQLVSLGIIGEYLGRIYTEVKRRPLYIVQERLGFREQTKDGVREKSATRDKSATLDENAAQVESARGEEVNLGG